MLVIWALTWILQGIGNDTAISLWHWFGQHTMATILMCIFMG